MILQNAEYTWNHLQKQILKNFTSPFAYINEPPVEHIPKDTLYMGARPSRQLVIYLLAEQTFVEEIIEFTKKAQRERETSASVYKTAKKILNSL